MAHLLPEERDELESDLGLVQEAIRSGVTPAYANKKDAHWDLWIEFCAGLKLDPFLRQMADPVPLLQVFAQRYRDGRIAPSGKPVRSRTAEDALRSVGQMYSRVGTADPRTDRITGKVDFRIGRQLRSYKKADPAPSRVKPIPITIVIQCLVHAFRTPALSHRQVLANMICIGFYFCLRPGEYTGTTSDDHPFLLEDVAFHLHNRRLANATASDAEIEAATSVSFTFTEQKNQQRNECISHARSGDILCCPVKAAARQFIYHRNQRRQRNLPYDGKIPLASYYSPTKRVAVTAKEVTSTLRWHANALQSQTGIKASDISARSLRAGGAMALLCADVDSTTIKLLARWNSDSMMKYLHQQSLPVFQRLATKMFANGTYSFLPDEWVPSAVG